MNNNLNRTKAASLNAVTMMLTQIIGLVLKFGVQTAFIHELNQNFLGLNGLFTNVVGFLSFADLGIGTAITVSLYKPIADGNMTQLHTLLGVFRKVYLYIIGVMTVVGILISPFVHVFIKNSVFSGKQVAIWFLIYFIATVASYFSAYKRSFMMAVQQGYLNTLNDFCFKSLQQITQILVIMVFHSFWGFLCIQAVAAVLSNWQLSNMAKRHYPNLFDRKDLNHYAPLRLEAVSGIKKNVVGALSSKIGEIVVSGTDNIILSGFIGLVAVAKYSNYMLIVQSINSLISQVLGAFVASIGNLHATSSKHQQQTVMLRLLYLNALINIFVTVGLAFSLGIFINIWAGSHYLLSPVITAFIVVNCSVTQSRYTALNFISGMGLYWSLRWKSIIEAAINLILSMILVVPLHFGILGVVLGTLVSNLVINVVWEPYIVFHDGLHLSMKRYMTKYLIYEVMAIIFGIVALIVAQYFVHIGIVQLIGLVILVEVVALLSFILMTCRSSEFKYSRQIALNLIKRFL